MIFSSQKSTTGRFFYAPHDMRQSHFPQFFYSKINFGLLVLHSYTHSIHTLLPLHFCNSEHAIGVGLIAFSVEMTNKAKGKRQGGRRKRFCWQAQGRLRRWQDRRRPQEKQARCPSLFSDDELNAAPRRMDMPDKSQSSSPRVVPKEEMLAQN